MSLVGKEVLPFTAQAFKAGEDFFEVSEDNFKGHWSVVVFYPADFSFVCPTELEDVQEQLPALQELGVEVFSVSTASHFVHKAWHDHSEAINKLTYTMIADPSQQIYRNLDVLIEEKGVADRGTFIIDPDGVIQAVEINADGIGRDASALVDKIKAAQYVRKNPGEVCPANWKEGEETLKPSLDLVGKI